MDDSDESSSKPIVNVKFAVIRALSDALRKCKSVVWLISGTT